MLAHQTAGVERITAEMAGRALVAYEQGCGKTWVALEVARRLAPISLLVVCPEKMRRTWVREATERVGMALDVTKNAKAPLAERCVMSYALARIHEDVRARTWGMVILDESHNIKNPDSDQSKILRRVAEKARYALLLTGTPELSFPAELWAQLAAVTPGTFGDYTTFTARYCDGHRDAWGKWVCKGAVRKEELRERMAPYMLRVLKVDVMPDLPPKKRFKELLDITDAERDVFTALRRERTILLRKAERGDAKAKSDAETALMYGWKRSGEAKLPAGLAFLHALIYVYPEEKIAVFVHHHAIGDAIEAEFESWRDVVRIDGKTPKAQIQGRIDALRQKSAGADLGILSLTACGAGITLCPGVGIVVFFELPWTPALALQGERSSRGPLTRRVRGGPRPPHWRRPAGHVLLPHRAGHVRHRRHGHVGAQADDQCQRD